MEIAQSEATSVPAKPIEGLVADGGQAEWDNDPAPKEPKKRRKWPWSSN